MFGKVGISCLLRAASAFATLIELLGSRSGKLDGCWSVVRCWWRCGGLF